MELRRGLAQAQIDARRKNPLFPCSFVFIDWPDIAVRVFSGSGVIQWDGETWNGVTTRHGTVADMVIPETGEQLAPREATFRIIGQVAEVLNDAADQRVAGRTVRVWSATTTGPGGNVLASDPVLEFTGYVSDTSYQERRQGDDAPTPALLTVDVTSGVSARASADMAHSSEDQQRIYPGDTFFDRTANARIWERNVRWPAN